MNPLVGICIDCEYAYTRIEIELVSGMYQLMLRLFGHKGRINEDRVARSVLMAK